mmetsp:Transcript_965/g.1363  ORF Transcript_965/g.1363 Transcript_965/m.1363 type:complete len:80 (-) Transcript_965:95-334(-)
MISFSNITPRRTRTGAEAYRGTARKMGSNGKERRKHNAVTTLVKPVRPPTSTPANDSPNAMTGVAPRYAEMSEDTPQLK